MISDNGYDDGYDYSINYVDDGNHNDDDDDDFGVCDNVIFLNEIKWKRLFFLSISLSIYLCIFQSIYLFIFQSILSDK